MVKRRRRWHGQRPLAYLAEAHDAVIRPILLYDLTNVFDGVAHVLGRVLLEEAMIRARINLAKLRGSIATEGGIHKVKAPCWGKHFSQRACREGEECLATTFCEILKEFLE